MKKFLSVVLALVMTMSLVTISAGATDFTDDSKVKYNEAVDVISTIGVVDGYTDGSFNPTATLTRGAAAKIICNLILGPTTAGALSATTAPFSDVPVSNVFSGYITYCSQESIINGYSDGTFKPSATVTGYQFMKMLLGALGYDGSIEGFTGANWSVAVAKLAVSIGLDDGNDSFVGSAAMTREEACLYAFNTLKATMVEYSSKGTTIVVGGTTITSGSSTASKVTTASDTKTIKNDGYVQFAETHFEKLKKTSTASDDFGRPAAQWTYKSSSIGTYADSSDLLASYTVKATRGTLYDLVGKDAYNDMVDGTSTLTVYVDGIEVSSPAVATYVAKSNSTTAVGGNGTLTEVYMDDSNNVTIVVVNTYLVQASADYSTSKETLGVTPVSSISLNSDSKTLSNDDFAVSGYSADDYILVTATKDSATASTYTIQSVAPATSETGTVSAYTASKNVTVGGTQYSYAANVDSTSKATSYTVNSDSTVYLDSYGYVIYVDTTSTSTDYLFLTKVATSGTFSDTYVAATVTPDGTYKEITLKSIDSDTTPAIGTSLAGVYTYAVNSSSKYTLTSAKYTHNSVIIAGASAVVSANNTVKVFSTSGNSTIAGLKATSSTVFVVRDSDNDIDVYTGIANAPDITSGTASKVVVSYVMNKAGTYLAYVLIDCYNDSAATIDATTSASDYVFVLNTDDMTTGVDSAENTYYTYKVIKGGEETTVNANSAVFASDYSLYKIKSYDSDSYIDNVGKVTSDGSGYYVGTLNAASISYSSGVLSMGSVADLVLGSSANIYLVDTTDVTKTDDGDDYAVTSVTGKELANDFSGYVVTGNYVYEGVSSSDDTVVNLYIYVSKAVVPNSVSVVTVDDSTVSVAVGATDASVTASISNSGTLTAAATTSDAAIATATVNVSTGVVTITGVASGTATITVKGTASDGSTAATSATITVTVAS